MYKNLCIILYKIVENVKIDYSVQEIFKHLHSDAFKFTLQFYRQIHEIWKVKNPESS